MQAQRGLQRGPRREFEERAAFGFGRWRAGTGELGSEQAHGRRGVCCRRAGAWPGYVGCVLCVWVLVGDAWNLEGREGEENAPHWEKWFWIASRVVVYLRFPSMGSHEAR